MGRLARFAVVASLSFGCSQHLEVRAAETTCERQPHQVGSVIARRREATGREAPALNEVAARPSARPSARPAAFDAARERLAGLPVDPAPRQLILSRHYLTSNEQFLERFRPRVEGKGGVMLGVGSDQNYILAGWARPGLVVVSDFDQVVVDLHAIYRIFFKTAATPEAFMRLWYVRSLGDAALREAGGTKKETSRRRYLFEQVQDRVHTHLWMSMQRFAAAGTRTILDDPEQYRFVADLVASGRFLAVRGDWTGKQTIREVARILDDVGLDVTTLYLSNVEEYFPYTGGLGENLAALPMSASSAVLRTFTWTRTARAGDDGYRYVVQSGADLRAWLASGRARRLRDMVARAEIVEPGPIWLVGSPGP